MKTVVQWLGACLVAFGLLAGVWLDAACADMIPASPGFPENPKRQVEQDQNTATIPLYSMGAGVVAVTLTGSLITLRAMRKRNGK